MSDKSLVRAIRGNWPSRNDPKVRKTVRRQIVRLRRERQPRVSAAELLANSVFANIDEKRAEFDRTFDAATDLLLALAQAHAALDDAIVDGQALSGDEFKARITELAAEHAAKLSPLQDAFDATEPAKP